ncbi:hypothetical protein, partial [Burkholderia sp. Ax-1720]|uniref:hypothetical protein n=1 Tax=Burkholderia sp. Ax-1720 TaxID=2608335 RepID=UPI001963801E
LRPLPARFAAPRASPPPALSLSRCLEFPRKTRPVADLTILVMPRRNRRPMRRSACLLRDD